LAENVGPGDAELGATDVAAGGGTAWAACGPVEIDMFGTCPAVEL